MSKNKKTQTINPLSAVALAYDGKRAPLVTAKGYDELAEQIIAIAKEHDIHLHQDKSLLALLSTLEVGDEIPRQLYIAIAEIIAFVYWLEDKKP